jgi:hypothetical protein
VDQRVAWLYSELPALVARGILTGDAAEALRRHYGSPGAPDARLGWGQILLASFGALLVGGGLILILAHNWDVLSRPGRAAVAFGMLIAAQAATIYAVARRGGSAAWREATSALLVAAVGAAIALVGQTYHVGGSFEGLLVTWLCLVVLIPYLTGSALAAIGFWALLILRAANTGWRDTPLDPWLLALVGFPYVVLRVRHRPRSWATALVTIAATASVLITGSMLIATHDWPQLPAVFQVSILAAVVAAAAWPPRIEPEEPWRTRVRVPAWFGLIAIATILSFDDAWRDVAIREATLRSPSVAFGAVVSLACAVFASVLSIRLARGGHVAAAVGTGAAILVIAFHALAMLGVEAGWLAFNAWLLAVGVLTLIEGIRSQELGTSNRGLFALAALILSRFFDTDLSFLARGLVFVGFGTACFLLNLWLMRRTRGPAV